MIISESISIENLDWHLIPNTKSSTIYAPFNEDEISLVIKSFESNKVLGPDGFPLLFYKKFWNILKGDILDVFREFHEKGIINKNMNNTFIALIAKRKDYTNPKDFRATSLTTSLYKIIVKTLAN